jgi:hypothetical protein
VQHSAFLSPILTWPCLSLPSPAFTTENDNKKRSLKTFPPQTSLNFTLFNSNSMLQEPQRKRARSVLLPSLEEVKSKWYQDGKYIGPGKNAPQFCASCHRPNYEYRWQAKELGIKNPAISHEDVCPKSCSGFEVCQQRNLHAEIAEKKRKEKEALQLSTPKIKDWVSYEKFFNTTQIESQDKENLEPNSGGVAYLDKQLRAFRSYTIANTPNKPTAKRGRVSYLI